MKVGNVEASIKQHAKLLVKEERVAELKHAAPFEANQKIQHTQRVSWLKRKRSWRRHRRGWLRCGEQLR